MKQQSEPTAFETNLAVRLSSPNKLTKIVGSPGSDGHNVAPSSSSSLVVKYKSSFLQVLAAFVALLGAWAIGCILCYTSPAIPSMKRMYPIETLQSHSSNQTSSSVADATSAAFLSPEDHESETWITSIINLGALAGSIIGGPLNCRFGHRRFLFVVGVGCAVGWLVIAFANHVWLVLLGRAITGFCGGLICVSVPVYIVDIATIGSRGFLGCSFQGQIINFSFQ